MCGRCEWGHSGTPGFRARRLQIDRYTLMCACCLLARHGDGVVSMEALMDDEGRRLTTTH
eukprot:4914760-Prymnesium_polylepis.1